MKVQRQIRKKTFQHIEQELFCYRDTKKEIEHIREEIIRGTGVVDNPEGSRSNLPSDPTGNKAVQLASHKELGNMEKIVDVIDEIYYSCDRRTQQFIDLFYFARPRTLTLEGVAQHLYISKRNIFYVRHKIVRRLAQELGWW